MRVQVLTASEAIEAMEKLIADKTQEIDRMQDYLDSLIESAEEERQVTAEDRLSNVSVIVDQLDRDTTFHQEKNRVPVQIETPYGWFDLADYLDELVEALGADRG